jgi:putative ABC transport system substrate-binding protein
MKLLKNTLIALLILASPALYAGQERAYLVLSGESDLYSQVTTLIRHYLTSDTQLRVVNWDQIQLTDIDPDALLITVGRKAAEKISQFNRPQPVVFSFIDAETLNRQLARSHFEAPWAATVINQPAERLIQVSKPLIRTAYRDKLLVILDEENQWALDQIEALPQEQREYLDVMVLGRNEVAARLIEDSFFKVAAVVALNDTVIWSGNSAKWILHQAYTYQVPVVGYAQTFQKAGAMVSVYSSLDQIANSTAKLIDAWHSTGALSSKGMVYSEYHLEMNDYIARALKFDPNVLPQQVD